MSFVLGRSLALSLCRSVGREEDEVAALCSAPLCSATCMVYLAGVGRDIGSRACVCARAWPGGGFLTPCPRRTFNIFNAVPSEFAEASRKAV